ncbi:hypothetical protein ETB97_002237 [Aspergillus alliaceus]|uniref:Uncharacterized protein n=1 Tax=Petromyces alliaceus TaxID=209559 RepID=A0A8H6E643_PETAA|nr:hypothetical protein ETB97_002237 [Aspergillus burnettii]
MDRREVIDLSDPELSAPGCLVDTVIEALLRETSEHVNETRACLDNSMHFFHLEGPLRGPPGARIRPDELHSSICSGIACLATAEDALKEALECVQAALRSLRGE